MEHEFIKLEHIDTSVAAKNFAELLNDNKTYFLNGSWGSGKTEFLEEVKNNSSKNFITIDFWRLTDTRSTVEIAFSKLHPFLYWFIRVGVVLLVAVSILMTNVVDIGLSNYLSNYFGGSKSLFLKIGGVVALIVAVWQVFKKKSDEFYSFFLSYFPKSLKCRKIPEFLKRLKCLKFLKRLKCPKFLKRLKCPKFLKLSKVLIIDDFDRMSKKQQEESYKLFSLIKGKLPIVFVGDITKVQKNDDNYLSKIIDRQVELPFDLYPSKIWNKYFRILEDKLKVFIPREFKKWVELDNKNLRDREHFNDYVNQEFFTRGKLDHVQINQQLLVIYVYLFYPDLYKKLLNDKIIDDSYYGKINSQDEIRKAVTLEEQLTELQNSDNMEYPLSFKKNKLEYLLYEQTSNRTEDELLWLFYVEDEGALVTEIVESEQSSDFYQYLSSNYQFFNEEKKNQLLTLVIKESISFKNSASMNFIVLSKTNELTHSLVNGEVEIEIIKKWEAILGPMGLDQSQIIYFLVKHTVSNFFDLGKYFSQLSITPEVISGYKRKDFLLLTYLKSVDLWYKVKKWDDSIWECIDLFDNREFLSFWVFQNIIGGGPVVTGFDSISKDKYYTVLTRKDSDLMNDFEDGAIDIVISKISPKLEKLKRDGYELIEI